MSTVVHARFSNVEAAHRAAEAAQRGTASGPLPAEVHQGRVREEEVTLPGTDAFRGALLGGVLVGGIGAVIAVFFVWPNQGYWFGFEALVLTFLGSTIFGVIAGGLAGASEVKASVRASGDALAEDEAMLTCEVDNADVPAVCAALRDAGGIQVQAA